MFKDRLNKAIEDKGISAYQLSKETGIPQGTISNYRNKEVKPSTSIVKQLALTLGVSSEWLLEGVEEPLVNSNVEIADRKNKKNRVIKYYPSVNGSMGGLEFLDNPNETSVDMIVPGFSECKFAINAYGDSMFPVIKSGQVVLLMEWQENFIEWGRIYLIVTKTGYRTIKYLKPSKENDSFSCESENKENNPPFDIKKEDILKLFLVKGWVCREAI